MLNKVHYGRVIKNRTDALCGAGRGMRSGEIFPVSRETRDITCLHCKRALKHLNSKAK